MMKFTIPCALALRLLCVQAAQAEDTMLTTTTVQNVTVEKTRTDWVKHEETVYPPGTHLIDLAKLDANGDGILTRHEVGAALFHIFDADGNNLIDNVEFEKKAIATVVPVKETQKISYYSGDNDVPDKTVVSSEDFLKATQLARFGISGAGLSPHDFAGKNFADADINHDHFIDMKEWVGAYDAAVNAENVKKQEFSLNK